MEPRLSVVIASYNSRSTLRRCLDSLRTQTCREFEVILVDSSDDGTAELVAAGYPEVRLIRSPRRLYPGAARNLGIRAARANLLAFVDTDCVADPDWVKAILEAHRSGYPIIGGVVENANPGSLVACASYACEFGPWMPRRPAGSMREIPTCCLSLRRDLFERFGPFREDGYCSDTAFNWTLAAAGFPPRLDPRIRVAHINIDRLGRMLRKQRMHGRTFGRMRLVQESFSPARALVYLLGIPLLPPLLLARRLAAVLRLATRPGRLLAAAPLILLGLCAWSWGEGGAYAAALAGRHH